MRPKGYFAVVSTEVEIAQREGFLKHGVVALTHQSHEHRLVVTHVVASDLSRRIGQAVGMRSIRRAQQEQCGRQRSAGDNNDIRGVRFGVTLALNLDRGDCFSVHIGQQAGHIGACDQREVGKRFERRIHAHDLRVGLAIEQARKAIERVTSNTNAGRRDFAIVFVEQYPQRQMKRSQSVACKLIAQFLDARFVRHRGIRERSARRRLARILAALAMDMEQRFGLSVVRLELRIG
jgi:hypothetical protein